MRPAPLDRKLLRDLWRLRWQVLAISLLIACGVAVAVMAHSSQQALISAQDDFYAETRFAHVFAAARRAPRSQLPALQHIEGVTGIDARIVQAGLMDVPGLTRPAVARLISLPDPEPGLNVARLVRGRMPAPDADDEVVAINAFLEAADVRLGQRLTAVIGGRELTFTVVGAVLSPEYVYVPSPESTMPDDAHQAVFWAPRPMVERAAGMTGAFNTVALTIAAGTPVEGVLASVDRILAPYGGQAALARADQASHAFLAAELKELSTSATVLPPIFLLVAAGLVHIVMSRLVDTEREQIGLIKAFGYGDRAAAGPYLKLAAVIGLLGAGIGAAAGAALSAAMLELYHEYFRFPVLTPSFDWLSFWTTASASVGACIVGAALAVRRALALSPAVAMQPPRPASYERGAVDVLLRKGRIDEATRMIVRNLQRFPARSALACVGLASSLALLVGTLFMFDSIDELISQAFYRSQRWAEAISFLEGRSGSALQEVRRLPGVIAAEPVRIAPARVESLARSRLVAVIGLDADAVLQRPLDRSGRPIPLLAEGVVLSQSLAERLDIRSGDRVRVEILDGRGGVMLAPVTGLAADYSGMSIYMDRRALNRVTRDDPDLAGGAQLLVAADMRPAFYRTIERLPQVVASSSRDEVVAAWRQVSAESFLVAIAFYVGFAGTIAFGVAFNTARISLSERARDLATMRVLGFGRAECVYVLMGELLVLTLLAAPLGLLGGQTIAHALVAAYSRDEVRLPAVITARTYGVGLFAYLAAVAIAAAVVARRIWTLDLVQVLKTRE